MSTANDQSTTARVVTTDYLEKLERLVIAANRSEAPNSIEVHRNAKGEWSATVKVHFAEGEALTAKYLMDELHNLLAQTYPSGYEALMARLKESIRQRTESKSENKENNQ